MLSNPLRNILLSCLVLSSIVVGACDGDDEEDFGAANVTACENYVTTLTDLECWDEAYNPNLDCSAYSGTTCDISAYWDCLAATWGCDDMGTLTVDAAAAGECASMASCE